MLPVACRHFTKHVRLIPQRRRLFSQLAGTMASLNSAVATEVDSANNESVDDSADQDEARRERDPLRRYRKKYAILLGYSGVSYHGMQLNPDVPTIEGELVKALIAAELIPASTKFPGDIKFQRCARTDAGVSAVTNVVSMILARDLADEAKDRLNQHLPSTIKVFKVVKATKGFSSKNNCNARTYLYFLPTMAFAPAEDVITSDYRVDPSRIAEANDLLARFFLGTKRFHNFTRDVKFWDASCRRYIMDVSCGSPFVCDGLEMAIIKVKGQSFMMHQIRKMVGLIIAIMRGHATAAEMLNHVFSAWKVDVPRAPGLGLILEQVHMDFYNQRFGDDGVHDEVSCSGSEAEVAEFTKEYIYPTIIRVEKSENSMLKWLAELPNHKMEPRVFIEQDRQDHTALGLAKRLLGAAEGNGDSSKAAKIASDEPSDASEPSGNNTRVTDNATL